MLSLLSDMLYQLFEPEGRNRDRFSGFAAGGPGHERRQRVGNAGPRRRRLIGKMARNPLTAIGGRDYPAAADCGGVCPPDPAAHPLVQDLNNALVAPSALHWFGTDSLARTSSAGWCTARHHLYIVLLVSVTGGPLGLLLGVTAGYFGGRVDAVLMRVTDIFISFPSLVLALAFVAALGPGLETRGDC